MTTHFAFAAPMRSRGPLRTAMSRHMTDRERKIATYVPGRFPRFDVDPFAQGRDRRDSLFDVSAPSRA